MAIVPSQLEPVPEIRRIVESAPMASSEPATPVVNSVASRFAALPTIRVSDTVIPVRLCPANPNRKTLILTGQTPTGAYALGGPPDQGGPGIGAVGSQVYGLPLVGQQTVTLDTTGEVWAIMDNTLGAAGYIRVSELI